MTIVRLVALTMGKKKDGGNWYKSTFKSKNSNGFPIVQDYFLPESVGEAAIKNGLIEDVDVNVDFGFDDYMRIGITSITKATTTKTTGGI